MPAYRKTPIMETDDAILEVLSQTPLTTAEVHEARCQLQRINPRSTPRGGTVAALNRLYSGGHVAKWWAAKVGVGTVRWTR